MAGQLRQGGCGWVMALVLAGVAGLIALFTFSRILPQLDHDRELLAYRSQWQDLAIGNYTITVQDTGTNEDAILTVEDGALVHVEAELMVLGLQSNYEQYAVDGLFEEAARCFWFCRVVYDPIYGFPREIGGWLMDNRTVQVIQFEPSEPVAIEIESDAP